MIQIIEGVLFVDGNTGAVRREPKTSGLSPIGVKSIVYGGISTVVVLLIVLVALLGYYKHHQHRTKQNRMVTTLTVYKPVNPTEILSSSQHSSQQELMDSDEEVSSQGRASQTSIECRYQAMRQYPIQPV